MSKRGRIRIGALLAVVAAAMLGGCILENPGPDSRLLDRFNRKVLDLPLGDQDWLGLHLKRADDSIHVFTGLPDSHGIDSAEIFLYARVYDGYPRVPTLFVFPRDPWNTFSLHAKVRDFAFKGFKDIGGDSNRIGQDIDHPDWQGWVLRSWSDTRLTGHKLGGMWRGGWRKWDSTGSAHTGNLRGMISERGEWQFGFDPGKLSDKITVRTLSGSLDTGTTFATQYINQDNEWEMYTAPTFIKSRATVAGDSLIVMFTFSPDRSPLEPLADSLELRCARIEAP